MQMIEGESIVCRTKRNTPTLLTNDETPSLLRVTARFNGDGGTHTGARYPPRSSESVLPRLGAAKDALDRRGLKATDRVEVALPITVRRPC